MLVRFTTIFRKVREVEGCIRPVVLTVPPEEASANSRHRPMENYGCTLFSVYLAVMVENVLPVVVPKSTIRHHIKNSALGIICSNSNGFIVLFNGSSMIPGISCEGLSGSLGFRLHVS